MSTQDWWRDAVFYQIYPRSFFDSNGDGVGDLQGILDHLDHLRGAPDALGVDAIWLSPIYPSPNFDFGYDVKDHEAVDPAFGTLELFDQLVEACHRRGIKVVLDLVMNHTSHLHPWFREASASRDNPKRDWYLWADPLPHRRPPNRWKSVFGGSAWEWHQETEQYYYHMFLREQPDLNWRNREVRERMYRTMRFWLDRGVDGFRLDVFNAYIKDNLLRDNPLKLGRRPYDMQRHVYDLDRPELLEILHEIRKVADEYPGSVLVGEPLGSDPDVAARYLGDGSDMLHLVFNFELLEQPWHPGAIQRALRRWDRAVPPGAQPCHVLSNHDVSRHATRYGGGPDSDARAKVAAMLLLTQRGTPFLYAGEEIGLKDTPIPYIEIQDPLGKRYWPFYKGRDGCRAPIPWDSSPHGGFTRGQPWLRVTPEYPNRNMAAQKEDPDSVFHFYRRLIALRRESPALLRGRWLPMIARPTRVFAYLRECEEQTMLVALNFTNWHVRVNLCSALPPYRWKVRLSSSDSTHERIRGTSTRITLHPYEACILERVV